MRTLRTLLATGLLLAPVLALAAEKVNINSADAETLARLIRGVGASRAEAIVSYRDKHGPFTSVEDLALVRGIGSKTIEENREVLTTE